MADNEIIKACPHVIKSVIEHCQSSFITSYCFYNLPNKLDNSFNIDIKINHNELFLCRVLNDLERKDMTTLLYSQ